MTYLRRMIIEDSDGDFVKVDAEGHMYTALPGEVDATNSTDTPLAGGGVFTGASKEVLDYAVVTVHTYSDVASAVDGLRVQWSTDGTNWDSEDVFSVAAATGKTFSFQAAARYMRVVYTNGATLQTAFRLQTILKHGNSVTSTHRIQDSISTDDDAVLTKSVITGRSPSGIFNNFQSTAQGNFRVAVDEYGDTPSIDAFARLRISEPFTLFDSKQLYDKQPLFWDESLGGTASSVHSTVNAETLLTVGANTSDYAIRQTKQRMNYQPGKGALILMSFRSPQNTGVTTRVGCFDGTSTNNMTPKNGIFFESNDSVSWNIAKNGTLTETALQANWNVDKLDGTGPSGVTLDLTATQIMIIDYEWLGVGRVRVGFVIDGRAHYCHYFNHSNDPTFTSVYMSTPNLPLRYDIQGDGSNDAGTLAHICSTVISEGGQQKTGILRAVDTGVTHLDIDADEPTAIVGIRLKSTHLDLTVIPESVAVINEQNDDFRWSLCLNPTYSSGVTWSNLSNSGVQKGLGSVANNITDEGVVIASGYASVDTQTVNQQLNTALKIGSTIAGAADELVLVVTPLSAGADIQGSLNFRELL